MDNRKKVVLGMSGGVDSSVAALLLKKEGYDVYGFFMNCGASGKVSWPTSINWKEEEETVRKICKILGIELFVVDCEKGYEKNIIAPMFESYERGLTPNPDILCNNIGKFPGLLRTADEIGAEFIATGHYARVRKGEKGFELLMGKDKSKDQSYFLVGLGQKILRRAIFPIGNLTKKEVREIALKNNFPNWNKRGSRGICYLGKIDMKKFLKERIKEKRGKVLSAEGEVIGAHYGAMFFTIGERAGESKGFEINKNFKKKYPGKLFVASKLKGNVLVVVPKQHALLKTKKVYIKNFKLVNPKEEIPTRGLTARIRHLGELHVGSLKKEKGKYVFVFDKSVEGVAGGQFIAIYKRERLIGGGEVRR